MKPNPIDAVYDKLEKAGFSKQFVKDSLLPTWWKDEMAETDPTLFLEAAKVLANKISQDVETLINPEKGIVFPAFEGKFITDFFDFGDEHEA